jgi:flagellar hook-length control protein FliK
MQTHSTSSTTSAAPALPVTAAAPQSRGEGTDEARFADVLQGRRAAAQKGADQARDTNAAAGTKAPERGGRDATGKEARDDAGGAAVDVTGAATAATAVATAAAPVADAANPALTPPPAGAVNDILAMLRGDAGDAPADATAPGFAVAAPILRQLPGAGRDQIVMQGDPRGSTRRTAEAGADARPGPVTDFSLPGIARGAPAAAPGTPRADAGVAAVTERPGAAAALRPAGDAAGAGINASGANPGGSGGAVGTERAAAVPDNARQAGPAPAPDARVDTLAWLNANAATADAASRPAAAPVHTATIEAPVGSPKFTDAAASQVTWMANNGIEQAEIRVKPAELGPISVRIEMQNNEAVISFAVTQPETRAAVEDSLHKLQEMLADSGIALGQTSVGGQGFNDQARDGAPASRNRVTFAAGAGDAVAAAATGERRRSLAARGLVDTFA